MTAGCIPGFLGDNARTTVRWLLDRELVQFVASDAYHDKRRSSAMKAAAEVLDEGYGQSVRHQLTLSNPDLLTFSLFGGAERFCFEPQSSQRVQRKRKPLLCALCELCGSNNLYGSSGISVTPCVNIVVASSKKEIREIKERKK